MDTPSRQQTTSGPAAEAAAAKPEASAPTGSAAVLGLQRSAGNQAVTRGLARSEAFAQATAGASAEVPRRGAMEAAFRTSFADVRAHVGGAGTQAGLGALGAQAAAQGSTVAFADAAPSDAVIAHELAHVVQQRRGTTGVAAYGGPDSPAERAAERAADAVVQGRRVPDVGAARAGDLQLLPAPAHTAGGVWATEEYAADPSGVNGGATIKLKFTPEDPVEATKIRLSQSVKTLHAPPGTDAFVPDPGADKHGGALTTTEGRAIDQKPHGPGAGVPFTNPLYPVETTPDGASTSLRDPVNPSAGKNGQRGGGAPTEPATLSDSPSYSLKPGERVQQSFEVTALAVEGAFDGLYLGSIRWGWQNRWLPDPSTPELNLNALSPPAIEVARQGSPSAAFMRAAEQWNAAQLTDESTHRTYDTVDLPIVADPVELSTAELMTHHAAARQDADAAPADRKAPCEFQAKLLLDELRTRNVSIRVQVNGTADDVLDMDEVYIRLTRGPASYESSTKTVRKGHEHTFTVPITALGPLPFAAPVKIEVLDWDVVGADELVATLPWATPYAPLTVPATAGSASYVVTASMG